MVIGKGMLDGFDTCGTQAVEEAPRIADGRHRMNALTAEAGQQLSSPVVQRNDIAAAKLHRVFAVFGDAAIADAQIHPLQPTQRFAQRAGRHQPPIAEAAYAVDHADLHVARQPVMLQSVVGDQHIAAGVKQQSSRRRAIASHRHRHAAGMDQAGLVADLRRIRRISEQQRFALIAAIAATDHTGPIAACTQGGNHRNRQRRLAGAAHAEIADHDDRYRQAHATQPTEKIKTAAQADHGAVQRCQRPCPPRCAAIAVPG